MTKPTKRFFFLRERGRPARPSRLCLNGRFCGTSSLSANSNIVCVLFLLLFASAASARQADGRLGLIRFPISTRPEFTQPGGNLVVEISSAECVSASDTIRVSLESNNGVSFSVDPARQTQTDATATLRYEVAIPIAVATGSYSLAVQKGDCADVSRHSVFVRDSYPTEYSIMHVTDIHVGRVVDGAPIGEQFFERMKDVANRLKPDLVIMTGDLSDNSDPVEFKKFIEITEQFDSPTFTVPGNHDRNNSDADTFLGPGLYDFLFGIHLYLGFDTQYMYLPPDPTGQMDWIRKEVRANKSAPFKVIFSHRPESDFRFIVTKIVIPNKVNLLLLGHTHFDTVEQFGSLPSRVVTSAAAIDGNYRIINVKDDAVEKMKLKNISEP